MTISRLRLRAPAWLHWPRRTARLRFTALYGGLFLFSGAALVAITYVLFERATRYTKPQLPQIPHAPADPETLATSATRCPGAAQARPESAVTGPASADPPLWAGTAPGSRHFPRPEAVW